ncbi:MAG: hypothetical protein AB8H80_04710 [Planctomycetota bacterium]
MRRRDGSRQPTKRRPSHILGALLAAAAATQTSGCRGFDRPRAETLLELRAMPWTQELFDSAFEIEIDGPMLAGIFDAVLARAGGGDAVGAAETSAEAPALAVRLQLFPDLGGKVLDVVASPLGIFATGDASRGAPAYRAEPPLDRAEPHLALLLGALLAEVTCPPAPARVLGERRAAEGRELQLRPALAAGSVVVMLEPSGEVRRYRISIGWLQISVEADGRFEVSGADLRGRIQVLG